MWRGWGGFSCLFVFLFVPLWSVFQQDPASYRLHQLLIEAFRILLNTITQVLIPQWLHQTQANSLLAGGNCPSVFNLWNKSPKLNSTNLLDSNFPSLPWKPLWNSALDIPLGFIDRSNKVILGNTFKEYKWTLIWLGKLDASKIVSPNMKLNTGRYLRRISYFRPRSTENK